MWPPEGEEEATAAADPNGSAVQRASTRKTARPMPASVPSGAAEHGNELRLVVQTLEIRVAGRPIHREARESLGSFLEFMDRALLHAGAGETARGVVVD